VPFRVPKGNREVGLLNGVKRRKNTAPLVGTARKSRKRGLRWDQGMGLVDEVA
jgi:hypothetical protein